MKLIKLIILLFAVSALFVLSSCNLKGDIGEETMPTTNDESTAEEITNDSDLLTAEEALSHLREGMTYGELVSKIGEPDGDIGSGAIIYAWELADGQALCVYVSAGRSDDRNEWIVTSFQIEENKSTAP